MDFDDPSLNSPFPILKWIFSQDEGKQLLLFAAHGLLIFGLCIVVLWFARTRLRAPTDYMPVAPSFVAITTLFSLLFAFHAGEVWNSKSRAKQDFI